MDTNGTWRFPSLRTFFGLNSDYLESVYEEIFFLKYYGNWDFTEAYNLPIGIRRWFLKRLEKQKQLEAEAAQPKSKKRTMG